MPVTAFTHRCFTTPRANLYGVVGLLELIGGRVILGGAHGAARQELILELQHLIDELVGGERPHILECLIDDELPVLDELGGTSTGSGISVSAGTEDPPHATADHGGY